VKVLIKYIQLLILLSVILIEACSSSTNYKVLSTFFDGVPKPENNNANADSTLIDSTNLKTVVKNFPDNETQYSYHPSYQQKVCGDCHNKSNGSKLIEQPPVLCYSCHEDFSKKFETLHVPVEAGECLSCHNPHLSKFPKLLLATGHELCFTCHDSAEILKSESHKDINNTECTDCHNPHGN